MPATQDKSLFVKRAAIARASRAAKRDPSRTDELVTLQLDYAGAKLKAYVERVVAEAPTLTDEQRDRLAVLLRGA